MIEIYDGIEINSCKDFGDNVEPFWPAEDADFFTMYFHRIGGGVDAIIDFPTFEEAIKVSTIISEIKGWDIINNVESRKENTRTK